MTFLAAESQSNAVKVSEATDGKIDVLANNAATNHFMPMLDEDLQAVRDLFEVNTIAPMAITQAFAPLLIKV